MVAAIRSWPQVQPRREQANLDARAWESQAAVPVGDPFVRRALHAKKGLRELIEDRFAMGVFPGVWKFGNIRKAL